MPFMFENLEVYQKAISFADGISDLTEGFSIRLMNELANMVLTKDQRRMRQKLREIK